MIGYLKTDCNILMGCINLKFKIVSDSSSNVNHIDGVDYSSVPLKIYLGNKEYIDNEDLDTYKMLEDFSKSREKSSTSCPNIYDWLEQFRGNDEIFAITISSRLSGSYSSAINAKEQYLQEQPNAKVTVIDSLSTGPEMHFIINKIKELHNMGKSFEEINAEIEIYTKRIVLFFCLKSLENLARNGRVNSAIAKVASVLGIQFIGKASDKGELQMLHKCRGKNKSLTKIVEEMEAHGFTDKEVIISHCNNVEDANELKDRILDKFSRAKVDIENCGGLCTYYAERGGLILGFVV